MSAYASLSTATTTLQSSLQWMADHMGPTAIVALPTNDVAPLSTAITSQAADFSLMDVRDWLSDHMGPTAIVQTSAHINQAKAAA